MSVEPRDASGLRTGPEVMASVDEGEYEDRLVIADISCDEAWLSMTEGVAPDLTDWR